MDQQHRRLDGVQVHSAKGDVSGQRTMEEKDTGMVSCCRQPSEEEGRLQRAIENNNSCTTQHYTSSFPDQEQNSQPPHSPNCHWLSQSVPGTCYKLEINITTNPVVCLKLLEHVSSWAHFHISVWHASTHWFRTTRVTVCPHIRTMYVWMHTPLIRSQFNTLQR